MSLTKQEFTNGGRAMLGRAQNGERLTISKIVVGSGLANLPSELWPLTALIVHEMDVTISATRDYGNGTLLVEGSFNSPQAPHSFSLREVGIMAHIASEPDALYSVANCFADTPVLIDPAAPTIETFKVKLIVDRIPTGDVVVTIGPSENVLGENVLDDTIGPGVYKEVAGNTLRFKRLHAGPHMEISEDEDENVITIGIKTITADLDLYVPANYPGITDPNVLFPTIQDALDSVADLLIPADKFVTVHVYSGNFTVGPTVVDHPNASQIKIIGKDIIARPITGAITTAGTAPDLTVTVNIANTSGIAAGDLVGIFDAPDGRLETCGYVTSVRAGQILIHVRCMVAPQASINALSTTKLLIFPTQYLSTAAAGINVFDCKQGVGLIKNFALRSTQTSWNSSGVGIVCNGDGALENVLCVGFYVGFGVRNGNLTITPAIMCSQNQIGMQPAPTSTVTLMPPNVVGGWSRAVFSGNVGYGLWITGAYYPAGISQTYAVGNATGIRADGGGFAHGAQGTTQGGIVVAFNTQGIHAEIGGVVICSNDSINFVAGNVSTDIFAQTGSQISIVHNVNTSGNYTPPLGVLGPSGAYIQMTTP